MKCHLKLCIDITLHYRPLNQLTVIPAHPDHTRPVNQLTVIPSHPDHTHRPHTTCQSTDCHSCAHRPHIDTAYHTTCVNQLICTAKYSTAPYLRASDCCLHCHVPHHMGALSNTTIDLSVPGRSCPRLLPPPATRDVPTADPSKDGRRCAASQTAIDGGHIVSLEHTMTDPSRCISAISLICSLLIVPSQ